MHMRILVVITTVFFISGSVAAGAKGPLVIHPDNPRYLMVKGDSTRKAILLSGSHTWAEFQTYQDEEFDYVDWLDKLAGWHHNFMRGWTWEDGYYSPMPYAQADNKYDLAKFNAVYFERLKKRIREAGRRDIYVSVMLFQGWSVLGPDRGRQPVPWPRHPYRIDNNLNGINGDPRGDGDGYEVHTLQIPEITRLQEDYVKHFIDELNEFDNVIWEIGNECHAESVLWQYHMIDYVKRYEAAKPKQHLVWINSGEKEAFDPNCHADIVSPGGEEGYLHDPPVATGTKIVIADSDHLAPLRVTHVHFWKWFTRGMHPVVMDCGYQGLSWWTGRDFKSEHPKWQQMRTAIGVIRDYADQMNLARMAPQDRKTDFPSSTRYCLYELGKEYLVYQPASDTTFGVQLPAGTYRYQWIVPTSGKSSTGVLTSAGDKKEFTAPFPWPAALHLKRM